MSAQLSKRVMRVNKFLREHQNATFYKLLEIYCTNNARDVPRVLETLSAVKRQDFDALLDIADSLRGTEYPLAASHYAANQLADLIRKYPLESATDPEEKAWTTFQRSEDRCRRFNRLFRLRRRFGRNKDETFHHKLRNVIRYVIGDRPNLASVWSLCGFGPGASVGVHGDTTHAAAKLASTWSCSPSAVHYFLAAMRANLFGRAAMYPSQYGFLPGVRASSNEDSIDSFLRASDRIAIVNYNKLEFVPKTAKTHRSIAIEPLGNGFVQKGIDQYLRQRLRRWGIDLTDQQSNSDMAREGSIGPEYRFSTLDLSSASDSISIELVRDLLPPEWFAFLNAVRSKNFMYGDVSRPYEKFCSMGNGFCFPLQSLIFGAVCHCVTSLQPGKGFRVYGDDMVVPREFAQEVIRRLSSLGFVVNIDKTYVDGPFKESCGGDWFEGENVRSYTLDAPLDSVQKVYEFCNAIRRNPLWESRLWGLREFALSLLPDAVRLYRPFPGPGDTCLDSDGVEHLSCATCTYKGMGVWRWVELRSEAIEDHSWLLVGGLEFPLQLYAAHQSGRYTFRRKTRTRAVYTKGAGATSQWVPGVS